MFEMNSPPKSLTKAEAIRALHDGATILFSTPL